MRLDSCFFILCRGSEVAHHARRLVSPSCLLSSIPPPAWRGARAHSGFASSARALAAWERRGHTRARPGKRERERESRVVRVVSRLAPPRVQLGFWGYHSSIQQNVLAPHARHGTAGSRTRPHPHHAPRTLPTSIVHHAAAAQGEQAGAQAGGPGGRTPRIHLLPAARARVPAARAARVARVGARVAGRAAAVAGRPQPPVRWLLLLLPSIAARLGRAAHGVATPRRGCRPAAAEDGLGDWGSAGVAGGRGGGGSAAWSVCGGWREGQRRAGMRRGAG